MFPGKLCWRLTVNLSYLPEILTKTLLLEVTSVPPITAKYFRINARSWVSRPCLRFDLGGCKHLPEVGATIQSRYALASIPSISNLGQLINLQPPGTSLQHCGIACHRENGCVSFIFDSVTQTCRGYPSIRKTSYSRDEKPYYYNAVYDRSQGYKHTESGNFSYKVIEMRQNKANASALCVSQGSWLANVRTLDRQTVLQTAIQQNNLLKQDFRFYVSGQYTTQWQHSDGAVIDITLWSPSNPDPAQGHCVMLTQNGLSSVDCSTMLFLICEQ
ncbi:uncharacterized protein LOC117314700 [Pecten maximus]|uniref:uncharacterized protein LOC117314700 n=1 Tax=Pecten maximus TaxID=6579 RepID=UPI001458A6BC|nr:uncharacterized protein LOC117314700 [Pecten maximus]